MNTDERPDLRRGGESKLILKAETEKLIGFAFEVLNELGHGLSEKVYENSLTVLFKLNGIGFDQQRRFPVFFRSVEVGEFIPDLIAFGSVIVDTKVIDRVGGPRARPDVELPAHHKAQGGLDFEFQEPALGVGTRGFVIRHPC